MTEEKDNNIEEQMETFEHLFKMAEKIFGNQHNEEDQEDTSNFDD